MRRTTSPCRPTASSSSGRSSKSDLTACRRIDLHSHAIMKTLLLAAALSLPIAQAALSAQENAPAVAAPDVKPGSITCEDVPYPYPTSYLPLTVYGQDVRMAYMDV